MNDEACKITHENITKDQERTEKRLNEHSSSIDQLTSISDKLTTLVESHGKQIERHEDRILSLEKVKPWYESDIGKYVIKAAIWLLVAVVAAAIGLNALDTLKAVQTIKA